ncbi:MAG: hypothetical protein HQ515_03815 [Phycisphaeraceae bacterium]|nr:hypothetical protein [Phycisphaeraceae bacterium]
MQNNYDLFQTLNADILYVAQLERDPTLLPRIKSFVQHEFPVVCDPNQISRKPLPIFNAYIVDKTGVIRSRVPGSLSARPGLAMILEELCRVEGVPPVKPREGNRKKPMAQGQTNTIKAEEVMELAWMWSHDRIAPGDTFKLAFLPTLASGFHVYAPQEKRMTPLGIELTLPQGITLDKPFRYPKPDKNRDPFLEVDVFQYEKYVPITALNLKASESLPEGDCVVKISVSYQACNEVLCYPPTTKTIEIPIRVVPKATKRNQVSGWKTW